jgi:hypothetical protein
MRSTRDAIHARCEPAVERHEPHEHDRLAGGRVRTKPGAAAEQDQRLANRLDHRVADEQQEDVQQQQRRGQPFAGANVGEDREQALERRLARERRIGGALLRRHLSLHHC